MKTLYVTRGNNMYIDVDTNSVGRLDTCRQAVDYLYMIPEKMHIVYESGEYKKEFDAEQGDLLITFYEGTFKNKAIIVKNAEWTENIVCYNNRIQLEKEEYAAKEICDATPNCEASC